MSAVLLGKRHLYVTLEAYCDVMHVRPDTVRWQLRHGKLRGRKFKRGGWRVLASEIRDKEEVNTCRTTSSG